MHHDSFKRVNLRPLLRGTSSPEELRPLCLKASGALVKGPYKLRHLALGSVAKKKKGQNILSAAYVTCVTLFCEEKPIFVGLFCGNSRIKDSCGRASCKSRVVYIGLHGQRYFFFFPLGVRTRPSHARPRELFRPRVLKRTSVATELSQIKKEPSQNERAL